MQPGLDTLVLSVSVAGPSREAYQNFSAHELGIPASAADIKSPFTGGAADVASEYWPVLYTFASPQQLAEIPPNVDELPSLYVRKKVKLWWPVVMFKAFGSCCAATGLR